MKRVISLLLVLIFCLCLPISVFAETSEPVNSPGQNAPTGDISGVQVWFALLAISMIAVVVMTKFYKKTQMQ